MSPLTVWTDASSSPSRSATPGPKWWTRTPEPPTRRRTTSRAAGLLRSRATLRLHRLRLSKATLVPSTNGPHARDGSPCGRSTLTTDAPSRASVCVASGPARLELRSRIAIPARGCTRFLSGGERPEADQGRTFAGRAEDCLDLLPDLDRLRVAVDEIGEHLRPFGQLDEGEDVLADPGVFVAAPGRDREAVDAAPARGLKPGQVLAVAGRAHHPGPPEGSAAVVTPGQEQPPLRRRVPERSSFRGDGRNVNGQGRHASSRPRITVALPIRVESHPRVPWARAKRQSGTCTAGWASPRTCRTASMIFVMRPRFCG